MKKATATKKNEKTESITNINKKGECRNTPRKPSKNHAMYENYCLKNNNYCPF